MTATFHQIEKLMNALGDPEYRFLLLEPLILFGIVFGLVTFVISFFLRAAKLQTAALVVIGLSAMLHIPYLTARNAAQPRMEQVYKIKSPSRVREFNANSVSWQKNGWKFFTLALVAAAAVLVGVQRNRLGITLAIVTVLLSLIGAKNALWLHYRDSVVSHPNLQFHQAPIDFREQYSPPPERSEIPGATISQSTRISQPAKPRSTAVSGKSPKARSIVPMKAIR